MGLNSVVPFSSELVPFLLDKPKDIYEAAHKILRICLLVWVCFEDPNVHCVGVLLEFLSDRIKIPETTPWH